ncbi:hypothetical protein [Burkholderia guangdongensis]|uniref:hypothetical protein n=1 Tax=Burkholderia guangdongensis TaxID=1792500 RepID=UPI0015CAE9AC|nr:hypothetical protein [Burkholderia guangdongensis]
MSHRFHLAGRYEGRELDSIARKADGGFKLVAQLARMIGARTWTLVKIEHSETIYPDREAAHAASRAALKLAIDGGFA